MIIIPVDGDIDYRLQCFTDRGVYFKPLGSNTTKQVAKLFSRLTDDAKSYSETLSIKGRNIEVRKVCKGIARFTFSELCEEPLGAEDYLSIAKSYHTVFVEGIPKLNDGHRNEAKRLMTLIDTLYDNRIKLVVAADASADKLYSGEDYQFEFQRTVSRLIEMQGEEYLAGEDS